MEVGTANDILHMLFSAKGLDNKVIVFFLFSVLMQAFNFIVAIVVSVEYTVLLPRIIGFCRFVALN